MPAAGEPIPTSIQEAGAAPSFPPRKPLPEDVRTDLRKHKIVGRQPLSSETVLVGGDLQGARDKAAQEGILSALAAAHSNGADPDKRRENVSELARFAVRAGVSLEEVKARLKILDEDPDSYFPSEDIGDRNDPSDAQVNGDLSTNKQRESTPEKATPPEVLRKIRQQEAIKIGHRILATELSSRAKPENSGAYTYVALSVLSEGDKRTDDHPEGLDLTQGSRIVVPVKVKNPDGTESVGSTVVDSITAVRNTDHGKVVDIIYSEPGKPGQATTTGLVKKDVPLQAILDGQFLAEAGAILDVFEPNSPQRQVLELVLAAQTQNAEATFQDLQQVDAILLSAAAATGMMTRDDLGGFAANIKRQMKGEGVSGEHQAHLRMAQELADQAADVILLTPDMITSMLQISGVPKKADVASQLEHVKSQVKLLEQKWVESKGEVDKAGNNMRDIILQQLSSAKAAEQQLALTLQGAELLEQGGVSDVVAKYQSQLEDGAISADQAKIITQALRVGDFVQFIDNLSPLEQQDGESAEQFALRRIRDEEIRARLKKAGGAGGILLLALAMMVTSVLAPH